MQGHEVKLWRSVYSLCSLYLSLLKASLSLYILFTLIRAFILCTLSCILLYLFNNTSRPFLQVHCCSSNSFFSNFSIAVKYT